MTETPALSRRLPGWRQPPQFARFVAEHEGKFPAFALPTMTDAAMICSTCEQAGQREPAERGRVVLTTTICATKTAQHRAPYPNLTLEAPRRAPIVAGVEVT